MIPVQRTEKPLYLKENADQLLTELKEAKHHYDKIQANPNSTESERKNAKDNFEKAQTKYDQRSYNKKYGKQPVKNALEDMCFGKCVYCDRKILSLKSAHIEHFKPKSKYIDLTFDWNNLLYCCSDCNQNKSDQFPIDDNGDYLLIDPTDVTCDIYKHLIFKLENEYAEIKYKDKRGEVVRDILKLNEQNKYLRADRSEKFRVLYKQFELFTKIKKNPLYYTNQQSLFDEILETIWEQIKVVFNDDYEYKAFALFYIIPYLAHHFRIPEAIELIKKVSKRSPTYAKFGRVDDLPS